MTHNLICVFDFETSSNRKSDTEVIQVAAVILSPSTLAPIPGAEFESLMRPLCWEKVQDDALRVNGKTREELALAPHPEEVWHRFADFVGQWNFKGKRDAYNAPIPAGHNIVNFDLPIYNRYCLTYKTTREERNGETVGSLFNTFRHYDTMQMLGNWFEGLPEPSKLSMDFLRKYFDMPKGDRAAHDALQDVRDTAAILGKLLRLHRSVASRTIWKDCFNPEKVAAEVERRRAAKERERARKAKAAEREAYARA